MNTAPDQKKVATFLFTFNYMQGPWRLDEPTAPRRAGPAMAEPAKAAEPRELETVGQAVQRAVTSRAN